MSLRMRAMLILLIGILLIASTDVSPPDGALIQARPILLDPGDPLRVRIGALHYLGGWELTSRDPRFGGVSAMAVQRGRLLAVSDTGTLFSLASGDMRLGGHVIGALPGGPLGMINKRVRDVESLTIDPESGRVWLGLEHVQAIWRYDAGLKRAEAHAEPAAMAQWPANGGPEAMVRLPDGRFLVFAEEPPGPDGTTEALLFAADPTQGKPPQAFAYRPPNGHLITDIARLPDGRLIALNRRYRANEGVSVIVTLIDPADILPGRVVDGRSIARLAPPLSVDNMEGIAVAREGGRTILWMISDNNFSADQRSLLLKFRLEE